MLQEHGPNAPLTGPLRIDAVTLPSGGTLGLTHCPGRNGVDAAGRRWQRLLDDDLAAIEDWGATTVVTLIESHEFARLGVAGLAEAMRQRLFDWHHIPIPDMRPPQAEALAAWHKSSPAVLAALRHGDRVLVHCAAGLGRTGTLVAKLLTHFAIEPGQAISIVRAARPGTLETPEQEAFVFDRDAWSALRGT